MLKLLGVGALILLMLIPLLMIEGVLNDRLVRRNEAVGDITASWGKEQNIIGPVLCVPYLHHGTVVRSVTLPDGRVETREVAETTMARDGVFFRAVGCLNPRTRAPVVAIVLQGVWAAAVAMTGRYEQILNYVVTIDLLFFGLTGASLLIFRARSRRDGTEQAQGDLIRVPLHPITTGLFVLACWGVALSTLVRFPQNAGIGVAILGIGAFVYCFWAAPRSET
jgi:inner membrane protein involved in colicin E2 resistance